jgi:hypothetical protein
MDFAWVTFSNPVAVWWLFLVVVSAANVALWFALRHHLRNASRDLHAGLFRVELMIFLCAAYVFGCAFRSLLPRADVQRMALFDTWLSSIAVGRSVATIAEICFVIQWAIVLRLLGDMVRSDTVRNISKVIVPLIVLAECCSWYAVVTTSFLGNTVENSIWAVAFLLIAVALIRLLGEFRGLARAGLGVALAGVGFYLAFLVVIDVPMYFARWQEDMANGKALLGLFPGLHDSATRLIVTQDIAHWRDEMAWMGLYFSVAVWSSLTLCGFVLIKERLLRYRVLKLKLGAARGRLVLNPSSGTGRSS